MTKNISIQNLSTLFFKPVFGVYQHITQKESDSTSEPTQVEQDTLNTQGNSSTTEEKFNDSPISIATTIGSGEQKRVSRFSFSSQNNQSSLEQAQHRSDATHVQNKPSLIDNALNTENPNNFHNNIIFQQDRKTTSTTTPHFESSIPLTEQAKSTMDEVQPTPLQNQNLEETPATGNQPKNLKTKGSTPASSETTLNLDKKTSPVASTNKGTFPENASPQQAGNNSLSESNETQITGDENSLPENETRAHRVKRTNELPEIKNQRKVNRIKPASIQKPVSADLDINEEPEIAKPAPIAIHRKGLRGEKPLSLAEQKALALNQSVKEVLEESNPPASSATLDTSKINNLEHSSSHARIDINQEANPPSSEQVLTYVDEAPQGKLDRSPNLIRNPKKQTNGVSIPAPPEFLNPDSRINNQGVSEGVLLPGFLTLDEINPSPENHWGLPEIVTPVEKRAIHSIEMESNVESISSPALKISDPKLVRRQPSIINEETTTTEPRVDNAEFSGQAPRPSSELNLPSTEEPPLSHGTIAVEQGTPAPAQAEESQTPTPSVNKREIKAIVESILMDAAEKHGLEI